MHESGARAYSDLLVFLAAAGVVVPLFSRLKISPVLGFLGAGIFLGPDGLGRFVGDHPWLFWLTISDQAELHSLSELGVAFLLFMIGLELSWERLKAMRRLVFGLGMLQMLACTLVLGVAFRVMGQTFVSSAVLGMGLALSSTAVVMPVLAERGRLKGSVGRATFAVLLAQDLAVAPILITVGFLAALALPGKNLDFATMGPTLLTLVPAAIGLGLLVVLGRVVLRPMFRSVAKVQSKGGGSELFLAACLLVVVGSGMATQAAGLSMSIGALIAGVLLAETEYRREVEVSIEPFKGLLLGVFFINVGLGLDLDAVARNPWIVLGLVAGLTALKAAVIFGLTRAFGLSARAGLETALVLAPAGEFAFVVLTTGMVEGVASPAFTQTVILAATLSMFTVPLMAMLGQRLSGKKTPNAAEVAPMLPPPADGAVMVVGFGRVGRLIGELLAEHNQPFIAIDSDPQAVQAARKAGVDAYYGDAGRTEMLKACGVQSTRALIVTMDAPTKVDEVVVAARAIRQDMILIARARDDRHAARLYALGVTDAVPETTEATLQLAENTLVDLGVPMGLVLASIHERRDQFRQVFQAATPIERRSSPTRALRAATARHRPSEETA